ncbi:MAG: hypothetical protein ACXVEE_40200 [Polyangiales bacterium]
MRRPLLALLTMSVLHAGCGHSGDAAPPPANDSAVETPGDSGSIEVGDLDSGDLGDFDVGGYDISEFPPVDSTSPYPESCEPPAPSPTGTSDQAFCDHPLNPSGCPLVAPPGEALCAPTGLRCAYPEGDGFLLYECADAWTATGHACKEGCDPTMPGAHVIDAVCGSAPTIECSLNGTDYERARERIGMIASCCGVGAGNKVTAYFGGGCVSSIAVTGAAAMGTAQWNCLVKSLAGRKLECAGTLGCTSVLWELP